MKRVAGIDIGSFAVKAVEIEYDAGKTPVVSNFGLVTLPKNAVVGGDIRDRPAVVAAIMRLWSEGNFKSRDVCVGLSGTRVYLRDLELPAMSDEELLSAVRFEATTFLPGDTSEYEVDYEYPLGKHAPEQAGMVPIHLVATDNSYLTEYQLAVTEANLKLESVDASFLALFRAVLRQDAMRSGELEGENRRKGGRSGFKRSSVTNMTPVASSEEDAGLSGIGNSIDQTTQIPTVGGAARDKILAIVIVGADRVSIGVAENGLVTLARSIEDRGGDVITAAIASQFDLEANEAEALKRSLSLFAPLPEELEGRVDKRRLDDLVRQRVTEISDAISTTLTSYLFQKENPAEVKVLIGGGGSLTFGFYDSLRQSLSPEIVLERIDLLDLVNIDAPDLSGVDKDRVSSVMPEALALALGRWIAASNVRVINLLGTEAEERRQLMQELVISGASVLVLIAVLGGLFALRDNQLSNVNNQVAQEQVQLARSQSQLARLAPVAQVRTQLNSQESQLQTVLTGDISWPVFVTQLDTATPTDVWWTNLTGQAPQGIQPGTISFGGMGCSQQAPAHWLIGISSLSGLLDPWVSSSSASGTTVCYNEPSGSAPNNTVVTFSSTATLAPNLTPSRFQSYLTGEGISQ